VKHWQTLTPWFDQIARWGRYVVIVAQFWTGLYQVEKALTLVPFWKMVVGLPRKECVECQPRLRITFEEIACVLGYILVDDPLKKVVYVLKDRHAAGFLDRTIFNVPKQFG
jgi:hypothetical protein